MNIDLGFCECDFYWSGPNCGTYLGECDGKCDHCVGPGVFNCVNCTKNAVIDEFEIC